MQDSIIANPIGQQFGAHTETGPYTWYHDIFANSHNRNPLAKDNTQFINNVVYDYQGGATALSAPWSPTTKSIPTSSAASAYSYVIANAGALPHDQVDSQVIANVTSLGKTGSLWKTQKASGLGNDGYGNA